MQLDDTVGHRVARLRAARRWSQSELARHAKLSRTHLWKIESGELEHPRPATLTKLAVALNCEVDELTGRSAIRQLTPYERNPEYRRLIDALELTGDDDRAEILRHALWAADHAKKA